MECMYICICMESQLSLPIRKPQDHILREISDSLKYTLNIVNTKLCSLRHR